MPRHNRRRLVGAVAAVGAVLTFGVAPVAVAPPAQADFGFEDLLDPSSWFDPGTWTTLFDSIFDPSALNFGDADLTSGLDDLFANSANLGDLDALSASSVAVPDFDQWLQQDVFTPLENAFNQWVENPLGLPADSADSAVGAAPALAETSTPSSVTVPLDIYNTTEALADVKVGGGAAIPVVVDTGSNGLVMPWYDIGWNNIGFPTGIGFGAYTGGLNYLYLEIPTTIDFGGGAITAPTTVDAVLFAWNPNTLWPTSLESFLQTAGADGVLGIGANAVGPDTDAAGNPLDYSAILSALPGDLSKGALIDMQNGTMTFGANTLGDGAISVAGSPNADLWVSINGGALQHVNGLIDSGGVYGTMPSNVTGFTPTANGHVPAGTEITVYGNSSGTDELYSYTTTASNAPTVVSSGSSMNTGYMPFWQQPIWIGSGANGGLAGGQTVFGGTN